MKAAEAFLGRLLAIFSTSYPSCGFHSLHAGIFSQLSLMAGLEGFSGGSLCWSPRVSLQVARGKDRVGLDRLEKALQLSSFLHYTLATPPPRCLCFVALSLNGNDYGRKIYWQNISKISACLTRIVLRPLTCFVEDRCTFVPSTSQSLVRRNAGEGAKLVEKSIF